jgi:hypothetical protein
MRIDRLTPKAAYQAVWAASSIIWWLLTSFLSGN